MIFVKLAVQGKGKCGWLIPARCFYGRIIAHSHPYGDGVFARIRDGVGVGIPRRIRARARFCGDLEIEGTQFFCRAFLYRRLQHIVHDGGGIFGEYPRESGLPFVQRFSRSILDFADGARRGIVSRRGEGRIGKSNIGKRIALFHAAEGKGERLILVVDVKSHFCHILRGFVDSDYVQQFYRRNVHAAGERGARAYIARVFVIVVFSSKIGVAGEIAFISRAGA